MKLACTVCPARTHTRVQAGLAGAVSSSLAVSKCAAAPWERQAAWRQRSERPVSGNHRQLKQTRNWSWHAAQVLGGVCTYACWSQGWRALARTQVLGRPGGGRPAGGGAQWRKLRAGWQRGAECARTRPGAGRGRPRAGQHHREPQVLGCSGAIPQLLVACARGSSLDALPREVVQSARAARRLVCQRLCAAPPLGNRRTGALGTA